MTEHRMPVWDSGPSFREGDLVTVHGRTWIVVGATDGTLDLRPNRWWRRLWYRLRGLLG